jgi:hypothetical protein
LIDQATMYQYWVGYTDPTYPGRAFASTYQVTTTAGAASNYHGPPAPKLYLCPSDPSGPKLGNHNAYGGDGTWCATNYAANYQFMGRGGAVIPESAPDGSATTALAFERYGFQCSGPPAVGNRTTIWTYGYSANTLDTFYAYSPIAYWDNVHEVANGCRTGQVAAGLWKRFQLQPRQNVCDPYTTQGLHTAGQNVLMGDGSVKIVGGSVSATTWHAAITPNDKDVVGPDW